MNTTTESPLYRLEPGQTALVINVPHAGTEIPSHLAESMTPLALTTPDTDWHVHRLAEFAQGLGASLMVATHSRYVIDLNRDPGDRALYVGADNTELCPTRTFANETVYQAGLSPDAAAIGARRGRYWQPYHDRLHALVEATCARHGHAILLDLHSIRSEVPRFFAGRLPDLNLGTADGASCAMDLEQIAAGVLAQARGFTHIVNGRFKGGYITRHFGKPSTGVHALQLEMAQRGYLDEDVPAVWEAERAGPLIEILITLCRSLRLDAAAMRSRE